MRTIDLSNDRQRVRDMMRWLLLSAALWLIAGLALAAPVVKADAYPDTGVVPVTISATANGTALPAAACTLATGRIPTCDVASLAPGVYTFVMTATTVGGCTNGTNQGTCYAAGSASSTPFQLTLRPAPVAPQGLMGAP